MHDFSLNPIKNYRIEFTLTRYPCRDLKYPVLYVEQMTGRTVEADSSSQDVAAPTLVVLSY